VQLRSEKTLIALLAAVQFAHILDFVIMMPLGPQLMRAFAIDAKAFSVLVSSYTFSSAVFGIIGAFVIDRFDRKHALLFAYAGFLVGTLLCALAPTFETLLGARIFAGAFGGVVNTLVFTIVGDAIPEARRGRATGTIMASFSVASVIGIPIGLYIASLFSWHAPFFALAFGGSLTWILFSVKMTSMRGHIGTRSNSPLDRSQNWREEISRFASVLGEANHQRAFALTTCLMFAAFSIIPFISPYVVGNAGLPEKSLPLIYLCGGACTFFTSRIFGGLADRHGKYPVFLVLATASLVPIFLLTNLTPSPVPVILAITTLFMVLVSGRFVPAMALITSSANPAKRGSFMSVNNAIQHLASGLASLSAGALMTTTPNGGLVGYNKVGYLALGMTGLSLILAKRIRSGSLSAPAGHGKH
jgi:predicted MFS family arabinose efflux permease